MPTTMKGCVIDLVTEVDIMVQGKSAFASPEVPCPPPAARTTSTNNSSGVASTLEKRGQAAK